jgi:ATP-dependent DNA helicase RecG
MMLTEEHLQHMLADLESDHVERTTSVTNGDKFGQAICAFANDLANRRRPGYLIIGAKDSGELAGLEVSDQLLQNLAAIRSDGNVLPQPMMQVYRFTLSGGEVAVVEVQPADLPPVRYRGRIHVRIGPRQAIANEQEERVLTERRVAQAKSFDARPCSESHLSDLSLGLFDAYRRLAVDAETIAANNRSIEQQLASLRLFDPARQCPTHAGILLLSSRARFFLPGAYVQYLRFTGDSMTDLPIDQAEIAGDLLAVVREIEGRLRLLITTGMRPEQGFRERLEPNYPEWALRELTMNAIMHRNYESNAPVRLYAFADRLEITSPGSLYGEANASNFPDRNSYRNPIVAEAMKAWGIVNRFGYGVRRAQELLKKNGNAPAEFIFDSGTTQAVIYAKPS